MSVYNQLLSSSPFIKSGRPEQHYDQFTDSENYALDLLIDFIENLIRHSKDLKFEPLQISALAKSLHLLINYGQIEFNRSIEFSSSDKSTLPDFMKSMVCTIDPDEVAISVEGFERNDAGGDSFLDYYIRIGEHDEDYDIVNSLERWKHMFVEAMKAKPGFEIIDSLES